VVGVGSGVGSGVAVGVGSGVAVEIGSGVVVDSGVGVPLPALVPVPLLDSLPDVSVTVLLSTTCVSLPDGCVALSGAVVLPLAGATDSFPSTVSLDGPDESVLSAEPSRPPADSFSSVSVSFPVTLVANVVLFPAKPAAAMGIASGW
jgi:hypothetical protein